uniref:Putative methionine--tRNA ligase n=1 Tax=Anthurium amnicola TaxID=1678845 RepID=A0A1D1Z7W7_9ARAE
MASHGYASVDASRINRGIVSALSKHLSGLSIDQNVSSVGGQDIVSLLNNFLHLSEKEGALNTTEVLKWTEFANNFLTDAEAHDASLKYLNEHLSQKAVLLGDGLKTSAADIVVFSALHSFVSLPSDSEVKKVPHIFRWMDYIQNKEDFGGAFETIVVKKPGFEPHKRTSGDGKIIEEKKKLKEKEPVEKDVEVSITVLSIQIGLILKAWKHPSADSLLVEEIDLGDGNIRQVVSGLAKYYSPDDLVNRRVVLVTNVKPGKLRDVTSCGLVLCASNQDHTAVEPLLPPEGAMLGEHVMFSGFEGKPEDVLNPKKKQLEKITSHLYTDDKGVATFMGVPFMTSDGPCTSSIFNGGIK